MHLLFDSHILIAISRHEVALLGPRLAAVIGSPEHVVYASAASLWEIAIKTRLGKLDPKLPLSELPAYLETVRMNLLGIDHRHAVATLDPEPPTRDPFDRLLLSQCAAEGLQLLTLDRALVDHPLACKPA